MEDQNLATEGNITAATQPVRKRKRASEACTFCRKRKIKCTTERPSCANCITYEKTCHYEPIDETRNSQPRRQVQSQRQENPSSTVSPPPYEIGARSPPATSEVTGNRLQRVSRIVVSANGMSSYHGRTSALFEENSHDRLVAESRPRMSEEWVEKGLVAEAARQRQLEEINFRLGKFDFDGVEPELGKHLLSLHWNRQHHSFLITYRPAFMRDMACKGPYFSKLLLNAIYFGASKFSPRHEVRRQADDVRTAGWQFRERVRELLGGALDRSEITTIQALLVMTNSLFALGDERSAAWLYAGLAFRMIIDLGMHVDVPDLAGTRKFSDEDLEIRRRVFWGAFVVDKVQSLYQGRPVSIKESDTLVPMKFLDTYEEFEHWTPFAYSTQSANTQVGSPSYSISTFRSLCQLSVTMSDILGSIYTERSFDQSSEELSTMLEMLDSKLTKWHDSLPLHIAINIRKTSTIPPPHVLSLHAMYNVLRILLHRPFVADGHLYNTSRAISVNSFISCATAASDIVHLLRAYDKAFSVRRAPYLISYATYVAATIHARIAAKRGSGSDAHRSLETCLAVFRENQETNWAVRRANAIVQTLMKRLGVTMPEPDDLKIDRDLNLCRENTPDQSPNIGIREPSLQSLDIDGIIQSFVREHENNYPIQPVILDQRRPTAAPSVPVGPNRNLYCPPAVYPDTQYLTEQPEEIENGNSWLPNSSLPGDPIFSVDDLLYGFNGSALDSFPEWGAM